MFLISEISGYSMAHFIGDSNEFRGFWINDRQNGNMWRALFGRPAANGGPQLLNGRILVIMQRELINGWNIMGNRHFITRLILILIP
jgi:hypothetical protein